MTRKPEHMTVVIVSEEEAKTASVRFALRYLWRDCGYLWQAVMHHARRYAEKFSRGWNFKNRWWTRSDDVN
jgi:hypothetical protein